MSKDDQFISPEEFDRAMEQLSGLKLFSDKVRNPNRMLRIVELILELWELVPDWRFGQLIYNALPGFNVLFNIEDDMMEECLRREIVHIKKRVIPPRSSED